MSDETTANRAGDQTRTQDVSEGSAPVESSRSGNPSWGRRAFLVTLVCISGILLFSIGFMQSRLTSANVVLKKARDRYDAKTQECEDLNIRLDSLEARVKNLSWMREQVAQAQHQYRTVDDFPKNTSPFVFAAVKHVGNTNDTLNLTVPEGHHKLRINFELRDTGSKEIIEWKRLNYGLPGPASYIVAMELKRKEEKAPKAQKAFTLTIDSNHDQFATVKVPLPFPVGTVNQSSRLGSLPSMFLPNQYDLLGEELGVQINQVMWTYLSNGPRESASTLSLEFTMHLISEGPNVVPATEISKIFRVFNPDLQYIEDGIYEVPPPPWNGRP